MAAVFGSSPTFLKAPSSALLYPSARWTPIQNLKPVLIPSVESIQSGVEGLRINSVEVSEIQNCKAMANKILIVDDEPFNLDLLEQELSDRGYTIERANNGTEALAKVESS